MKKMTSSWELISEVQDIAFKYVKRGEELDTAGPARAANLCVVQFVRFAGFPARNGPRRALFQRQNFITALAPDQSKMGQDFTQTWALCRRGAIGGGIDCDRQGAYILG